MDERRLVLDGVSVVDFSEQVPGPNATRLLTGLGADVIKIERPGSGDGLRPRPAMFESQNRGKRSLAVNLKTERGLAAVLPLVKAADVVVEGYRPGVMDRLGLGFTDLSRVNPALIYASISGYGAFGPYRDLPGHDFQYLSYIGAIPPPTPATVAEYVPTTLPIADLGTALYSALSILIALHDKQRNPETFSARHLDIAIADCALAMMEPRLAEALTIESTEAALRRPGYGLYGTADGRYVSIGALEDHFWNRLVSALELSELRDERYATFPMRREHVATIDAALRKRIAEYDQRELVALLIRFDVPVAPVNDLHEPVSDPHFTARGMVHPPSAGAGAKVSEWPVAVAGFADRERLGPAPAVGEHSRAVLSEAGLASEEIDALIADGIVQESA